MVRNIFVSIILLLIFFTKLSHAENKIVFINLNYIFNNSSAGKDLNIQINKRTENLDNKIIDFKKEINNKKKKLLTQKNVLSETEYKNKLNELDNEIKVINISISKEKKNLLLFKKKIEKEFSSNLNKIIEKYSVDNSISIILKKSDLLMAKKNLDITNDIFNLFNEKIEKLTIK